MRGDLRDFHVDRVGARAKGAQGSGGTVEEGWGDILAATFSRLRTKSG